MRKLKKNQLKLEKEVVVALTGNELSHVVGGVVTTNVSEIKTYGCSNPCIMTDAINCETQDCDTLTQRTVVESTCRSVGHKCFNPETRDCIILSANCVYV